MRDHPRDRIVSRLRLLTLRRGWLRARQRVVFTNGVFDILHRGHIELLDRAKSAGDILIVGLNSDASVRRQKGSSRPINRQRDRAMVLASLRPVDYVCIFSSNTPLALIKALRPNVLVKGAEYKSGQIVGSGEVRSWGGVVLRFPMKRGYSSSRSIRAGQIRKRRRYKPGIAPRHAD